MWTLKTWIHASVLCTTVLFASAVSLAQSPNDPRTVLWANNTAIHDALDWAGSHNQAFGLVHSNAGIKISGSSNNVQGAVRYVTQLTINGASNQFSSTPQRVATQPLPYAVDIAGYRPGGTVQQLLGAKYFDKTAECARRGKWHLNQQDFPLAEGVYFAPCDVEISGSNLGGYVTIVTTTKLSIGGSQARFTPYYRGVQFAAGATAVDALKLSGSRLELAGLLWAGAGQIEASGSEGKFACGVVGDRIKLTGSRNDIGTGSCGVAPVINESVVFTTPEDVALGLALPVSDVDRDLARYEILVPPAHGTLSGTAPNLTYTPAPNYFGPDSFTFRAFDSFGQFDDGSVAITVTPVNDAPVITSIPVVAAATRMPYRYDVDASDVDGDALTYLLTAAPEGMSIDAQSGAISWTPTPAQSGSHPVRVRVVDGRGGEAEQNFSIAVVQSNRPPTIVSTPPLVGQEGQVYNYEIDATDPDNDPLTFSLDQGPAGMNVRSNDGLLTWTAGAAFTQPVRTFNAQCFVVPPESVPGDSGGLLYVPPLYQRVRTAITRGSAYTAPQTRAWDRNNGCLGCHVQTQTVLGLQASKDKASVDEQTAEFLLNGLLTSQQADGSIRRSHPEFAGTQTGFAVWALSYVPDRARTRDARRRALDYLWVNRRNQPAAGQTAFISDHQSGWLNNALSMTAVVSLSASRYLTDVQASINASPEQLATALTYRNALPNIARYLLANTGNDASNNLYTAIRMLGLGESRAQIADAVQLAAIEAEVSRLDTLLRARQRADGGWSYSVGANTSDALTSAWVGFALDTLGPAASDALVRRNIEYLLATQQADGTWGTESGLFGTRLATTGLVMAYLPVALQRLGNADLSLGHITLAGDAGARSLSVQAFNRGLADAPGNIEVVFYNGPVALGDELGRTTLAGLLSNESKTATIPLGTRIIEGDVFVRIAADATVQECLSNNNVTRAQFVGVRASDPPGEFDTQSYLLNIEDSNSAPVIVSEPVTRLDLGRPYPYVVIAEDGDVGDAVSFALTVAPAGLFIDDHDGRIYYEPSVLRAGTHSVTVVVRDLRGATATQSFTLEVLANRAPVITSTAITGATVGQPYRYPVLATDPDGDALTYALVQSPLTMSIDAQTGDIRWTPLPQHLGTQTVSVRVSDGRTGTATQNFTINVLAPNRLPTITSTAVVAARVGMAYSYDVEASDPDGDTLSYAVTTVPDGMAINAQTGLISWTPVAAQLGTQAVVVVVQDTRGGSVQQAFEVNVLEANRAPIISSTPVTGAVTEQVYAYALIASDADGDALSYRLTAAPLGMTINAQSGLVAWTPTSAQVGDASVAVEVSDGVGGTAVQSFTIAVSVPANFDPIINSSPLLTATATQPYLYDVNAIDPDGDPLSYALTAAPGGMVIDAQTGLLSWTPTPAHVGAQNVSLRVSDGRGGNAVQNFVLTVAAAPANGAPRIVSTPAFNGKAARAYVYDVEASDADGDALTYSLPQAPMGMTIDANSGLVNWMPMVAGNYPVTVRVADAGAYAEQAWVITVIAADIPLNAEVSVTPAIVAPGGTVRIIVQVNGAGGATTVTATLGGVPIVLDADGDTTLTAPTTPGCSALVVTVSDGVETATQNASVCVADPNDTTNPVVSLLAPSDNAEVTAPTEVRGSVNDANLARWALYVRPGNSPTATPTKIGEGTQNVTNAVVGTLDPTLMFNGVYVLILQGEDASGRVGSDSRQVRIDGDMKLGHFSITFIDAEVPLAGIPIRITRTYDTRQSKESLDFGYGWSVDYQNVRVRESRKLGFAWTLQQQGGGFAPWCVRPAGSPIVTVTLPDGETEQFRAKFDPECTPLVPTVDGTLVFEPVNPRTQSKLEQLDYGQIRWANIAGGRSDLIDLSDPDLAPVDPSNYRLTTEDGMVYTLDQNFGVRTVQDQAGNQLTYSSSGVVHSSGTSVQFVRDAQRRITAIVLPDGRRLNYEYNAAGDLTAMRDAGNNATRYSYLANVRYPHYLQDIIDARGVRAARNVYDDNGRLIATIDAAGQRTEFTHDVAGRVERVRNKRGFETIFVFDENGWVLSEVNALGEQKVHSYDAYGNVLSFIDPLNRRTDFVVDARGNTLEEKDPMGAITKRTWGSYNQLRTETDPLNRVVTTNTYAFNSLSGQETSYVVSSRDAIGNITRTPVDVCGSSCPNTGNLKAIIDPLGNGTSFSYDGNGNVVAETDALGNRVERGFDSMGRMIQETRTRTVDGVVQTLVTKHSYDAKGQLLQTEHPDGSIVRFEYDAIGKLIAETDAANRTTRFEYDATGRQTATVHPDGSRETTVYDAEGNEIAKIDRAGRTTMMVYDAANRLIETIYPDSTPATDADNPSMSHQYDAAGQLIAVTNERGERTTYAYDLAGRQTRVTDPLGNSTTHSYDLSGRKLSTTDALGRTTQFGYDLAGKLIETIHPDAEADDGNDANNPRTRVEYDAAGRKTAEIDEMGRRTTFAYDALGRLTGVTLAAHTATPFITSYRYDEQGQKVEQIDAENRVTMWSYDKMGRNLMRKLPMGQSESFTYNAAGERTQHSTFNGAVMSYRYDNLGRIATIDFPDATTRSFSYNAAGQVDTIVDRGATYRFAYDERDRLIQAIDAQGRSIDYVYDAAGNRTQLRTPSSTVRYGFDALNRLSDVVVNLVGQPADMRATYAYDAVGNRQAMTLASGATTSYVYDRRNRLKRLAHRTSVGGMLLGMSYGVDASGLRTSIEETQGTAVTRSTVLQYDALKRLVRSEVTAATAAQNLGEVFGYDKVGNRLTRSCTGQLRTCTSGRDNSTSIATVTTDSSYDANDRLTRENDAFGTFDYAYDAAGNLLSKRQGGVTLATYQWDVENRLVEAVLTPNGVGGERTTTRYRYDANGIRRSSDVIAQTLGAGASISKTRSEFLIDPNMAHAQVLEDWTAVATQPGATEPMLPPISLQNSYVFGDDLLAEARFAAFPGPQVPRDPADGGNDVNALIGANAGVSAFHHDRLGSTRLLTAIHLDAAGNPITNGTPSSPANETLTDQYAYTAFGESDIASTIGTTDNNYRYTGEQLDPNLGFYYLRARYMNPEQGRFVGMDSYQGSGTDPISLHKYLYANASPAMYRDPSGNFSLAEINVAQDIQAVLSNVGRVGFRQVARRLVGQAKVLGRAFINDLKRCMRQPSKCELPFNILATGMPITSTAEHIDQAQGSNPSELGPFRGRASMILHRTTPHSRRWLRSTGECRRPRTGVLAGKDCDEYPFASSLEGGRANYYAGRVSLEPTPSWESPLQGLLISQFYSRCNVTRTAAPRGPWWADSSAFVSVGVPSLPSFFICKD